MNHEQNQLINRSYRAYLLRLWQEHPTGGWRVTIQDPGSQARRAFSSLEAFIEYLTELTEPSNATHSGSRGFSEGGMA